MRGHNANLVIPPCCDDEKNATLVGGAYLQNAVFPITTLHGQINGVVMNDLFSFRWRNPVPGNMCAVSIVPIKERLGLCVQVLLEARPLRIWSSNYRLPSSHFFSPSFIQRLSDLRIYNLHNVATMWLRVKYFPAFQP